MNKYLVLANLIILSCSKSEDDSSSYSKDIKNNDINQPVNSGNIYFENETCKCPNALNGDKDVQYTPRPVVSMMCNLSLHKFLSIKFHKSINEDDVDELMIDARNFHKHGSYNLSEIKSKISNPILCLVF